MSQDGDTSWGSSRLLDCLFASFGTTVKMDISAVPRLTLDLQVSVQIADHLQITLLAFPDEKPRAFCAHKGCALLQFNAVRFGGFVY